MTSSSILGPEAARLDRDEAAFFRDADPWGFILFARNVESPAQLRRLTAELRNAVGREAPILIDQEGGRVQRMRPPHWHAYLPALDQMRRASDPLRAQWLRHRLIAAELHEVGIDVNCAPLADLVEPKTHHILRNRLYGDTVDGVVAAARAAAEGLLAGGVLPVLKHIPGYGRASVDSHKALPRVSVPLEDLRERDFAPFAALNDMAMGMTAHIVLDAVDPERPATTSSKAMRMIREEIGFDGLVMTDDLSMEALSGEIDARAAASIAAGCDVVLHCNGDRDEMEAVVAACGAMGAEAIRRAEAALAQRRAPDAADLEALRDELGVLTGEDV
ncbi:beta-N-acetylhexosaminidase [Limimaricola sp. G21655-S1]|uniref:beta-N-acetylhexosaminidase n=1 Tax=Limimaricola sp. G21655-S1 TaxID=3014768 RepID=UPI0022AF0009|nr:beta-N-acetylhexosaminidase [Limimaricola sp. G21655-S1]MCZ4261177.1 beta-N-acetylhexosaminidase [Limimaricola sp. G21655-S1]